MDCLDDAAAREAVASKARIFTARRSAIAGKTSILRQRIAALREEEIGLKSKIDAQGSQLRLIGEEVADVKFLVDKELARKPRLLELQRVEAEIAGALTIEAATSMIVEYLATGGYLGDPRSPGLAATHADPPLPRQ